MGPNVGRTVARLAVSAALTLGAFSIAPSAPASAVSAPASGYGFSVGSAWDGLSIADIDRELDAASGAGATWIRILFDWNQIEPAEGQFDWTWLDAVVDAAARHDLQVLGLLAYSAPWARPPGSFFTAFPINPVDYGAFASATVSRYADQISHWQLWNEPNLPQFSGFETVDGADYSQLLKAAYPAIKAVQPDSTVVAAALSRQLGQHSPPAFMAQIYAAGARTMFDAAAAHPYVFPDGLAADPENGWSDVGRIHDVMTAHGDRDKRVWLTEFGAPTNDTTRGGVSQEEQAQQIRSVLAAAATLPYSGPAFIYSIRDLDTAKRSDRESNFGALLTTDWTPKVSAEMLAS